MLTIVRHGESVANKENYWTGWLDVELTEKGEQQAKRAGEKIAAAHLQFDQAYCSVLKRSMKTCELILEESDQLWVPETKTWRLNERHYGDLVGKNKDEMAAKYGKEQVKKWRRGFYEMPPLRVDNQFDRRYDSLDPRLITHGENIAMTLERVIPVWQDELAPLLRAGKNVLVVAHGNSLRALVKFLEKVPENDMASIDIPNAAPVVYEFDEQLTIVKKTIL